MQFNSISYTWNADGIKEEKKKDLKVTISPSPQLLVQNGMLIRVVISPHQKLVELLKSTNPAIIIETFTGIALIDTGATYTCFDKEIAEKLGLVTTGTGKTSTANGPAEINTYPVSLTFPDLPGFSFHNSKMGAVNLNCKLDGQDPFVILIGRDLLSLGSFHYNGITGSFSFSI
ncbi:MAG: retropepsin-like aspartic protease [bacterium]